MTSSSSAPETIYLKDYKPSDFTVKDINLTFQIFDDKTIVTTVTNFQRVSGGSSPLKLDGNDLKLISLRLNGNELPHLLEDDHLLINNPGDEFTTEIVTEIYPDKNTSLLGLYVSGGIWCTQCEPNGFQKITYSLDRPDILTIFTTRIEADKEKCPVLLSNGNPTEDGALPDGRHYAVWHDPFPKPTYLFALVAGDLVHIEDHFKTMSGLDVALRIYVRDGDQGQCDHAMTSLKNSMKWDEDVFGCEYQHERFNIVAVSDFNMGAMENTSLNIFNTATVLAHKDTATDADFHRVEAVIGHEYFHNWSGNRVTCRDWFQLSLKEGFTVFREQEFSADMNSRDVQRIDDVIFLRTYQFPEDAGALAHPVRPESFIEIDNFYTVTIYEKGGELIRMQKNLIGADKFRRATDLYFEKYDGMAVTCDDFVACMEEASGKDLSQFKNWYSQAGTPTIQTSGKYSESDQAFHLTLTQSTAPTPGQDKKEPFHIPVLVGLVDPDGGDYEERLLELKHEQQVFTFENIKMKPVPSVLRNFSAPVKLNSDLDLDDLKFLMINDNDGFNKWDSGQTYMRRVINEILQSDTGKDLDNIAKFVETYGELLAQADNPDTDKALLSRSLTLPSITVLGQYQNLIDPSALDAARNTLLTEIRDAYSSELKSIYDANHDTEYSQSFEAVSRRSLRNTMLDILDDSDISYQHYTQADNMTDRMAALSVLKNHKGSDRNNALDDFYDRFKNYDLVVNKWFALQASSQLDSTVDIIKKLSKHDAYKETNPNRVRSLYSAFCMNNPVAFHDTKGSGYELLTETVIRMNEVNPKIGARLLTPFKDWRRYTKDRQKHMQASLEKILKVESLSKDIYEIASKSLND